MCLELNYIKCLKIRETTFGNYSVNMCSDKSLIFAKLRYNFFKGILYIIINRYVQLIIIIKIVIPARFLIRNRFCPYRTSSLVIYNCIQLFCH